MIVEIKRFQLERALPAISNGQAGICNLFPDFVAGLVEIPEETTIMSLQSRLARRLADGQ